MPKRGKGGSLLSRQQLLHSLVHVESWAVDLSWDIIARFGARPSQYRLPRAFFDDFVAVAEDEARHYRLLEARLVQLGSHYGAFPAHDGLWDAATATAYSLPARLAVEHCVHEARGLDVLPSLVHKFRVNGGDEESAALLEGVIYPEEVSHCAAGVRWLRYLHQQATGATLHQQQQDVHPRDSCSAASDASASVEAGQQRLVAFHLGAPSALAAGRHPPQQGQEEPPDTGGAAPTPSAIHSNAGECADAGDGAYNWVSDARRHASVEQWFHALVREHYHGSLRPPFNEEARARAGFGAEWYLPLATTPGPDSIGAHQATERLAAGAEGEDQG